MAAVAATGVPSPSPHEPGAAAAAIPSFATLTITEDDGIGVLTLDRPTHLNAMSPTMLAELPIATAWLADEAPFRALVVTGAGTAFSSGGDVDALRRILDTPGVDIGSDCRLRLGHLHQSVLSLRRIPYPVVAAVNGLAAGSGFSLALACDDRIASERAAFAAAYGQLGLSPDAGMSYLLPRMVGELRALTLLLDDRPIRAPRAHELGLVSQVVGQDELLTAAHRRASRLAGLAPHYVREVKDLVGRSFHSTLAEQLEHERLAFARGAAGSDFRIGLEAAEQGRRPRFARAR
jgi:2-(1,2-epoxy-1,2-dihydrophenyl)acetyl-CoA isomerase